MPMDVSLSVLITAFREAGTVGRAIEAFLSQLPEDGEILVICPDPGTSAAVEEYAARYPSVRHVTDLQRGKPAAVNVGLEAARGEIVVLSDGDVFVIKDALASLVAPFVDSRVGAVSGRPASVDPRDTVLGYWSHLLTEAAHQMRLARDWAGQFLVCSGYLYAFRRDLVDHVPEDALAEDAVISHVIARRGYRIRYAPHARVFVKYPTTYRGWLRQRVRSAGGYTQDYIRKSPVRMRSAWLEIINGPRLALSYHRGRRELFWTLILFAARLHLWLLVLIQVRILRLPLDTLWKRVETTK